MALASPGPSKMGKSKHHDPLINVHVLESQRSPTSLFPKEASNESNVRDNFRLRNTETLSKELVTFPETAGVKGGVAKRRPGSFVGLQSDRIHGALEPRTEGHKLGSELGEVRMVHNGLARQTRNRVPRCTVQGGPSIANLQLQTGPGPC